MIPAWFLCTVATCCVLAVALGFWWVRQSLKLIKLQQMIEPLRGRKIARELDLAAKRTRAARLAAGSGQRLRRERHGLFAVADEYAPAAPIQRQLRLPRAPDSRGP